MLFESIHLLAHRLDLSGDFLELGSGPAVAFSILDVASLSPFIIQQLLEFTSDKSWSRLVVSPIAIW